jgi:uncharacterized damage-inducible protein DinB
MAGIDEVPERRFAWSDMFVDPDEDPRVDGGWDNNERAVLIGSLADRRMTLELKCAGLDAEQMARRPIPPSDLSLLGLVRHLATVEHYWFRQALEAEGGPGPYRNAEGEDRAFAVTTDPVLVEDAWTTWRHEVAHAEEHVRRIDDLGELGRGRPIPVREVLVHLIEEYARHLGHADLLRERIDGRVGQ